MIYFIFKYISLSFCTWRLYLYRNIYIYIKKSLLEIFRTGDFPHQVCTHQGAKIHISPLIWSLSWCKALVTSGELHSTWWFSIKGRFGSPSGNRRMGCAQFKVTSGLRVSIAGARTPSTGDQGWVFFRHQTKLFLRLYSCVNPALQETRYQLDTSERKETNKQPSHFFLGGGGPPRKEKGASIGSAPHKLI